METNNNSNNNNKTMDILLIGSGNVENFDTWTGWSAEEIFAAFENAFPLGQIFNSLTKIGKMVQCDRNVTLPRDYIL